MHPNVISMVVSCSGVKMFNGVLEGQFYPFESLSGILHSCSYFVISSYRREQVRK